RLARPSPIYGDARYASTKAIAAAQITKARDVGCGSRPDQITNSERRRNGRTTLKADNNDLRRSSYVFLSPPHPTAPLPSPQTHAACSPFSIWFTSTVRGVARATYAPMSPSDHLLLRALLLPGLRSACSSHHSPSAGYVREPKEDGTSARPPNS